MLTHTLGDKLCQKAQKMGFGDLHIRIRPESNLIAIIAIHNTQRGPAIGGCRFCHYDNIESAIEDALHLAQNMSYKSAIVGLPHGGGKSVLIKPSKIYDRTQMLKAYGDFVNSLNGEYIAAVDSGTLPQDMDIVATRTPYVLCTTTQDRGGNAGESHNRDSSASECTARGVYEGIKAAVEFKWRRDHLRGLHIAIQGVGEVGYRLAQKLHKAGAQLTVSDINPTQLKRCAQDFNAKAVSTDEIYQVPCDVFSPCALSKVLNSDTIPKIQASIVAGAANAQLNRLEDADILDKAGILYAPDFVINAGGLIYAAGIYAQDSTETIAQQIHQIHDRLISIFKRSDAEHQSTYYIANSMAKEKMIL